MKGRLMKIAAIVGMSVGLVACSPGWEGTYVGKLSESGTCSDGSLVAPVEEDATVILRDDGDTVTWEPACGVIATADIDGDVATVRKYSCPAETLSDGTTRSLTVTSGTLTLDEGAVTMDLHISIGLTGTITGTCEVTAKGTLNLLGE